MSDFARSKNKLCQFIALPQNDLPAFNPQRHANRIIQCMNTLFPEEQIKLPIGFSYTPDFLSTDEEAALLNEIKKIKLHPLMFQGYEAKRKVASFGFDYNFDNRKLTKGKPIPPAFNSIVEKTASRLSLAPDDFAELLITEYPIGSVINWHRDAPTFDVIAGISLLSDCIFRLRPHDKLKQSRSSIISFPVRHGSLYLMQGAARTDWEHSISPVKNIRYSITLRTLKKK
jgi:alkylated DNA repair dioxygenase AlkB